MIRSKIEEKKKNASSSKVDKKGIKSAFWLEGPELFENNLKGLIEELEEDGIVQRFDENLDMNEPQSEIIGKNAPLFCIYWK